MTTSIDVLCPTERRPEWMPWLAAQFNRLIWPHGTKRLVVVDSSIDASSTYALAPLIKKEEIMIDLSLPVGEGLGSKRNKCLDLVDADLFTWMDDDDWYHPRRLTYMYERMGAAQSQLVRGVCGYIDIPTGEFTLAHRKTSCWSLGLHERSVATSARFENVLYGEDNLWQREIARTAEAVQLDKLLMIVGKHDRNHTPRVAVRARPVDKTALRTALADGGLESTYIEWVVDDVVDLKKRLGV